MAAAAGPAAVAMPTTRTTPGAGGAAGDATATAKTTTALPSGSGTVEATATASGGQGGSAGFPYIYFQGGLGNVGTAGGNSLGASATAINMAGDAIASAYGNGGQGGGSVPDYPPNADGSYSGGDYVGGAGGTATGTTAFAEGLTSAEAQVIQTGGSGSVGVQGGRGADSSLTNAVSAIVGAGGDIYLNQNRDRRLRRQRRLRGRRRRRGGQLQPHLRRHRQPDPSRRHLRHGRGGCRVRRRRHHGGAVGAAPRPPPAISPTRGDLHTEVVANGGRGAAAPA